MSTEAGAPTSDTATTPSPATEPGGSQEPTIRQPDAEAAPEPKRYKLRVEGEEREVDQAGLLSALLDDMGEDGVLSAAQISAAARRRMRAVTEEKAKIKGLVERLRNPKELRKALDEIYGDRGGARAFAEELIAEHIEEARMPESEREMKRRIAELEAREARLKEKEEREQKTAREQQVSTAQRQIGERFAAALTEAGMQPTPYAIGRMAALAESALDDGVPVDVRQLAREVSRDYEDGEVGTLLKRVSSDPAKLIKLIGKEGLDALRRYDIEQTRAKQRPAAAPAARSAPRKPEQRRTVSPDEWLDQMRQKGR